ncbi:MAG: hypothetical protein PVH60_11515 [Anaerolineales bacterium]|jgi:hypothetical protein
MKTILTRQHKFTLFSAALLAMLILSAFVGVDVAHADEGVTPDPGPYSNRVDERLEAILEKLNEWYAIQDENLDKANNAIPRIEQLLEKAEQSGIDTSKIQALMPELYAAVGRAESSHATAGEILDEHTGFNGGGKVKDRQQALETLRSAHKSLESAKNSLLEARDIVEQIIEIAKDLRDNYVPNEPSTAALG